MLFVLSKGCKAHRTHIITIPAVMASARTLPPFDVNFLASCFAKFCSLCADFFRKSPWYGNVDLVLRHHKHDVFSSFTLLSKHINKVTVPMNEAIEKTINAIAVITKELEMTSKEDLIATISMEAPHNAEDAERKPVLVTQLLTRCSSDGTRCRSHSLRMRTTSEVAFPNSRKGINNEDGKNVVYVKEMMPAVQIRGKIIPEIIRITVATQLRVSEERYMTVKTRVANITVDENNGRSCGLSMSFKVSSLVFAVLKVIEAHFRLFFKDKRTLANVASKVKTL